MKIGFAVLSKQTTYHTRPVRGQDSSPDSPLSITQKHFPVNLKSVTLTARLLSTVRVTIIAHCTLLQADVTENSVEPDQITPKDQIS